MKTSLAWTIVIVFVVFVVGWYSFMMPRTASAPTVAPVGVPYVAGNLLLGTDATTTLGTYLIGSNGMTLYTYAKDTDGVSNCSGQCAVAWPPYTITDTGVLSNIQSGISGQAGYLTRADGSMQVTYNGMPLYFFKNDVNSGDTTGEGVGGAWTVAKP